MAPSDPDKELSGLARSIDALFSERKPRGDTSDAQPTPPESEEADGETAGQASSEDVVWEEVGRSPNAADADPEALNAAVRRFIESDPFRREGLGHEIRDAAAALREANALDVLADAVEHLARTGDDAPDEAGVAMARALLTPGVTSRLCARLGAAREEERHGELVETCARLGRDMALALADALSDTTDRFARRVYLDAMVAMGQEGMDMAEEMVEDGRWWVVRNAVAIFGEVGGERAVELITSSLAHADAHVRREALLSLAKVGGEDARMLVYGMIEDPDPGVRLAAARAAGALKVERALKPLLSVLEGENDPDVVVAVLHALGQLGDPSATNAVEKRAVGSFFSKPPTAVRIAAYHALNHIGTPRAKSLIQDAAKDKNPEVKAAVQHLMGESREEPHQGDSSLGDSSDQP